MGRWNWRKKNENFPLFSMVEMRENRLHQSPFSILPNGKKKWERKCCLHRIYYFVHSNYNICYSHISHICGLDDWLSCTNRIWVRSSAFSALDPVRWWHVSKSGHMSSFQRIQYYWILDLSLTHTNIVYSSLILDCRDLVRQIPGVKINH